MFYGIVVKYMLLFCVLNNYRWVYRWVVSGWFWISFGVLFLVRDGWWLVVFYFVL